MGELVEEGDGYSCSDGRGFHADYDLTTDGELNDLTLQMDFLFTESGVLVAEILDAHYEAVEAVSSKIVAYVSSDYRWGFVLSKHISEVV